ncbi:MAG: fumarylacetoacetate hydrolase family protein [Planctomycetes bacterium]|nr:fumarylacetoacetate hydrolase family protein [Planctomycetota bacterium]
MKLVSYGPPGKERAGVVLRDEVVDIGFSNPRIPATWREVFERGMTSEVAAYARRGTYRQHLSEVRLGPPVPNPTKIVCLGLAYASHAGEGKEEPPAEPQLFCKAPSALAGPNDDIVYPKQVRKLDYEVELAVVIGRRARRVAEEEALSLAAGYMVLNDVSARCAQFGDKQWFRGKSFDTFCPTGPYIVTPDEVGNPDGLELKSWVNGEARQDSNTSELLYGVGKIISYVSAQMTLMPGDIIATGTPEGVGVFMDPPGLLEAGDVVEMEIKGIGRLRNRVVEEE